MGASNVDRVGNWIRENEAAYSYRIDLAEAAQAACDTTYKYACDRISALIRAGDISDRPFAPTREMIRAACQAPASPPATEANTPSASGISLDSFREQYDYREYIRKALSELPEARIYADQDMRALAGIPTADWRRIADQREFEPYRLRVRQVWHWARPETILEMRAILGVGVR